MDGFVVWYADFRSNMPEKWQTDEMGTDFHRDVLAWLGSLGLDPDRLLPAVGVCPWQGTYELHVDEVVAGRPGLDRTDPLDENNLLAIRRIVLVEKDSWPARPEAKVAV